LVPLILTAEPGTIRGDLGVNIGRNIIHGSDAVDTANSEISLWFKEEELASWQPSLAPGFTSEKLRISR
jgi:nucleoside-diphosphate kinase